MYYIAEERGYSVFYHKRVSDDELDYLLKTAVQGKRLNSSLGKSWKILLNALHELKTLRLSQNIKGD
jgi:hypothetical protein